MTEITKTTSAAIRQPTKNGSYGIYISPMSWAYAAMFLNHDDTTYQMVQDPRDAHILIWTGGADVDPQLYGEKTARVTHVDPARDAVDLALWELASEDQLKVGICRGGQFLNVMCGGKMWQDCSGHRQTHQLWCNMTEQLVEVTSTHHQMMIPNTERDDMWLVAEAHVSNYKVDQNCKHIFKINGGKDDPSYPVSDAEVIWYEKDAVLCFQPHPEIGHEPTKEYFFTLLDSILSGDSIQPETEGVA